jgi:DNA-3-methyladenine glycosylase
MFARPVEEVARALIGGTLIIQDVGGIITETEAYHIREPAAHSHRGLTPRNRSMFGPVGHLYVYRSYGIHWCLNIVCGIEPGCAVLVRALEPTSGIETMIARRQVRDLRSLTTGPGKLCQALGVTSHYDGLPLGTCGLSLSIRQTDAEILTGPRIGITKAVELPWRFGLARSRYLSRRFPEAKCEPTGVSPQVPQ